ncbi:DNA recombination protein RmuC [Thermanaerovibrio velox]|uniref:DNA recombination protein RmuC n=1 Tax=Thermanaerovibrio velox TaxID=108007 RepID=UPI001FDF6FE7|nr:DNA recombination protein RmuC [Thermanaerovibrio velox]
MGLVGILLSVGLLLRVLGMMKGVLSAQELERQLSRLDESLRREGDLIRQELRALREELSRGQSDQRMELREAVESSGKRQLEVLNHGMMDFSRRLNELSETVSAKLSGGNEAVLRSLNEGMNGFSGRLSELSETVNSRLLGINDTVRTSLDEVRKSMTAGVEDMRRSSEEKLDRMREVVEEKLHSALEKRLGEAFSSVSERLEKVHQGLGEMKTLAGDVGDLKRVLSNVKVRGTWGEVQLGNLLEQLLTPEQYGKNVTLGSGQVEFAVKLPGDQEPVWLPIDAKFPQEDYQRLESALEEGDRGRAEASRNALLKRLEEEAKKIRDKYVCPPRTTDFAIMYLPVEGLYAEALRADGLLDRLMTQHRVVPVGPTVLGAFLNSLQMGFRTLAIQQRSSEVWNLLGQVKTEFGKFGDLLEKAQKKIQEAGNHLEKVSGKTKTIERRLKGVEAVPSGEIEAQDLSGEGYWE